MGFFDKAKRLFGLGGDEEEEQEAGAPQAATPSRGGARPRGRTDRPPLADPPPAESRTLDEALAAREAGNAKEARGILEEIDRGAGLRVVLRAAAALEAGDEKECDKLAKAVAKEAGDWRLPLQVAGALGDAQAQAPFLALAAGDNAPAWALAWTRAVSDDEATRREGLVELLFTDAGLARTVAARDLHVPDVEADAGSAKRYAAFAHGRDSIRRFGAAAVGALVRRARGLA